MTSRRSFFVATIGAALTALGWRRRPEALDFDRPCDRCDAKAITFARDMYDVTEDNDEFARFEPAPDIKSGCALHPPRSRVLLGGSEIEGYR